MSAIWGRHRNDMAEELLHQPHDKFFKKTFEDPVAAAAFLQGHLQSDLVKFTDWSTLKLAGGSFIDEHLQAFEADLLFTAKLHGEDAQFYILCEHQSSEDPLMALRVLSYMVRIWCAQAKSQTGRPRLMPIIPVVVAQDKKAWKTTARFHDLFALSPDKWEEVRAFTPDFAFRLLQLVDLPYESIQGTPVGVLTLRALKAEPLGKLLSAEVWEPSLLRSVPIELLKYFIRYTFNADVDRTAFETKLKELLGPDLTENSMTLADQYRQMGVEQGLEKGIEQGLFRGELKALHSLLFDVLEIRFQSVPVGLRNELSLIQDAQKLSELHRRAIQCATLEEFVAAL